MNPTLAKLGKSILFRSPLKKHFLPGFAYNFTAPQLCFLCQCVEETRQVEGAIAEIGCSTGSATIFLNKYMDAQGIHKNYYAVDTFSGFVEEDIEFEVANRGKAANRLGGFRANTREWFDETMRQNHIARVQSIEADVNKYDLTTLGPLSFVLLDVDLYRPIKKALPELYQALSPGGIMVIDDCAAQDEKFDGSYQAYTEFMADRELPSEVMNGKLGIIRKEAQEMPGVAIAELEAGIERLQTVPLPRSA